MAVAIAGFLCNHADGIASVDIVFGEPKLPHLLKAYQKYYNGPCTQLCLEKDTPISRAVQAIGQTSAVPVLGGLHHQYVRA
jgi:hypothetical protein